SNVVWPCSGGAEVVRTDGQTTDALAGSGKNGIANGWRDGWHARLADAARALAAGHDVHFDDRRSVGHAQDFVVVEIALVHAALRHSDFAFQRLRQAEVDGALHLRLDSQWIDRLAAIHCTDHPLDLDRPGLEIARHLRDLRDARAPSKANTDAAA